MARQFPTRKAFRAWLQERENEIVGVPDDGYDCPLARFLKDQGWPPRIKVRSMTVDENRIRIGRFWALPLWACIFVTVIDGIGKPTGIRGATALAALDLRSSL